MRNVRISIALAALLVGSAESTHAQCGAGGCFSASAPRVFVSITPSGGINASTYNSNTFVVTNNSTDGVNIVAVEIDFASSLLPDMVFDPAGTAGDTAAKCFSADTGAGLVGLVTPPNPCTSPFAHPHDNGYETIELSFTDFDPGETFSFSVDVDPTSIRGTSGQGSASPGSVSGVELTGSIVTIEFDENTFRSGTLFRKSGSNSASEIIVKNGAPPAPGIQALGISSPASTSDNTQTIRVTGTVGETVRLLQVEAALDLNGGIGFDLDPFEANTAVEVIEKSATIGSGGTANVNVTLTRASRSAGYNYFRAVEVDDDGSGRTGAASEVVILRLVDGSDCTANSDCGDGNPCTMDTCSSGTCQHANNSASCNDGQFCNGSDTCAGGTCSRHDGDPCSGGSTCQEICNEADDSCDDPAGTSCPGDGNPCTDDECDGNGSCVHPDNTHACDDGVFCNGDDRCSGGACDAHAGDPCDGGAFCDEDGTECVECLVDENCDDGLFCTGVESCVDATCQATGDPCVGGGECVKTCDETGDRCRDDDGTACEDGDVCSIEDTCFEGTCVAGTPVNCDDGSTCNGAETCDSGSGCVQGQPFDCSAFGTECLAGTCQDMPFTCVGTPTNEGGTCAADGCTVNSRCEEGVCVGDPLCDPQCEACADEGGGCLPLCGHPISHPGGSIVATDSLAVLRAAVGESACSTCVCDVDASGSVVAIDALILLSKVVGQDVILDCPESAPSTTTTTSSTTTTFP